MKTKDLLKAMEIQAMMKNEEMEQRSRNQSHASRLKLNVTNVLIGAGPNGKDDPRYLQVVDYIDNGKTPTIAIHLVVKHWLKAQDVNAKTIAMVQRLVTKALI